MQKTIDMLQKHLNGHRVLLASGSPRRQQYFKEMGIPVTISVRLWKKAIRQH